MRTSSRDRAGEPRVVVPRWLAPTTLVLAVLGLGVASYLTAEHFSGATHLAGCSTGNGTINCGAVTTSPESKIIGIPVAVLGLAYFVVAIPFLLPVAWRSPDWRVRAFRQAGAVVGLGMVCWLVFAELAKIHHICEYCTSVHVITLILFIVITMGTLVTAPAPAFDDDEDDDVAGESAPGHGAGSGATV
ncbi:MAG TPA: vitamin K epoxide reductase family protein [Mycobacteriales bacterium]